MRNIRIIFAMALFLPLISCSAQNSEVEASINTSENIEAYYFHFNARCVTCNTVEAEAKAGIETLYPDLVNSGKIVFKAINLDDPSNRSLAERLGVNGQSLLIVRGDQKINITNEGFLYAISQPEKFKAVIKEKVDSLL